MKTGQAGMLLALAFTAAAGQAQDYPTRPVRVIVPYAPGGGSDILARTRAARGRRPRPAASSWTTARAATA